MYATGVGGLNQATNLSKFGRYNDGNFNSALGNQPRSRNTSMKYVTSNP